MQWRRTPNRAACCGVVLAALAGGLAPRPATAGEIDRMTFGVQVVGHPPLGLNKVTTDGAPIGLDDLAPVIHEVTVDYGVGVSHLASDLVLRVGYRFATGDLPAQSSIGSHAVAKYKLNAVPITVGWRLTLFPGAVHLLAGIDVGGSVASFSYEPAGSGASIDSGTSWCWELRGLLGVHIDVYKWIGLRLFAEARLGQNIVPSRGPEIDPSGVGFGMAVVATTGLPGKDVLAPPPGSKPSGGEPLLPSYAPMGTSRLDQAFALIRAADAAKKQRNFIKAEALYRRGIAWLPRDGKTRVNVEAPVRVDWAQCLDHIGRSREARDVLVEALRIDPSNQAAARLLQQIDAEQGWAPPNP